MEKLDHNAGVELIVDLLKEETLIPIFGSGFSAGCPANKYKVPNGSCATVIMKRILKEN